MTAEELLQQKPSGWEFLLFAEWLDEELFAVRLRFNEVEHEMPRFGRRTLDVTDSRDFMLRHMAEVKRLVLATQRGLADANEALGPPGVPTNVDALRRAAGLVGSAAEGFVNAHGDLLGVQPHPWFVEMFSRLADLTEPWLAQFESVSVRLREIINSGKSGKFHLNIEFNTPAVVRLAQTELPREAQRDVALKNVLTIIGAVAVGDWLVGGWGD